MTGLRNEATSTALCARSLDCSLSRIVPITRFRCLSLGVVSGFHSLLVFPLSCPNTMGGGSSVAGSSEWDDETLPDHLGVDTARDICLRTFGEVYHAQFSTEVFNAHAVDGVVTKDDFVKLVNTEIKSSLGKVWVAGGDTDDDGDGTTAEGHSKMRKRPFSSEELSLAKDTPLTKLVANMKRINNTGRTPCVLVGIGKYNPVNQMHLHCFNVARQYLERHTKYGIIGGYMCPMHDKLVKNACRGDPRQAIPGRRRLDMCQIATANHKWVDVGRWEIVQKTGHLDYPEILHRMSDLFKTFFQDHPNCADGKKVHTMYLCGGDDLVKCTPDNLREFGCVCITRPGWIQKCADDFREQWKGIVHVVEDTSVVDVALADLSSTKVRRFMKLNKDVEPLVGSNVHNYMRKHKLVEKMQPRTAEEWTEKDASMAKLKSIEIPTPPTLVERENTDTLFRTTSQDTNSAAEASGAARNEQQKVGQTQTDNTNPIDSRGTENATE